MVLIAKKLGIIILESDKLSLLDLDYALLDLIVDDIREFQSLFIALQLFLLVIFN